MSGVIPDGKYKVNPTAENDAEGEALKYPFTQHPTYNKRTHSRILRDNARPATEGEWVVIHEDAVRPVDHPSNDRADNMALYRQHRYFLKLKQGTSRRAQKRESVPCSYEKNLGASHNLTPKICCMLFCLQFR
jgi:hypothetical protein